jgi:hypothetical protein
LGIVSIFLYGFIVGPIAWIMGNNEIREIKAGLRSPEGERKARIGRVLGIIGTVLWSALMILVVVTYSLSDDTNASPSQDSQSTRVFLADQGVTFVYPDTWEEGDHEEFRPPGSAWARIVTPDISERANWITVSFSPTNVAIDTSRAEEIVVAEMMDLAENSPWRFTHGPDDISIDDARGLAIGLTGGTTDDGDEAIEVEMVTLFTDKGQYTLLAQYYPADHDIVLSAWHTMLDNLKLPSTNSHTGQAS